MQAEGELRSNSDESDRVRDLQDKVADMKAEVIPSYISTSALICHLISLEYYLH